MKRKQVTPIFLIFGLALALLLFYKPALQYKVIAGETQGTTYHITYQDRPHRNLQPKIEQLLKKFDLSLSTYLPNSIISQINKNNPDVKPDKFFKTVFNKADDVYHVTDGAFDITVAPLVNAYGFGPEASIEFDSTKIDSIKQYVGMDKIQLIGGKIIKSNPLVRLDVNAIAQGYSCDIVAEFLERKGISNYLIEIGGEILAKGENPHGEKWKIGIDKPIDNNFSPGKNIQAKVIVSESAVATSGNYRKFYEKDGIKFVHSINPKTGYPVKSRLLSTTVLAPDCITADAFATAFMIMGVEKSIMFLSEHKQLDAYLVYSDSTGNFKSYMTAGLKDKIIEEKD